MVYTVTITSQGQISIPAAIRRKLGMEKRRKALVSEEEGKLIVRPVKDFLELGGSLKTDKKPLSNAELHDRFATYVAQKYAKKIRKQE